jgi:glycosyltransferase involved in cell wall biosynthesis
MRILMVSYHIPPDYSGAGVQALRLASRVQNDRVRVTIITASPGNTRTNYEILNGVEIYRLRVLNSPKFRSHSFAIIASWFLLTNYRSYDIIHLHGAYWRAFPIVLVSKIFKKKIVIKLTSLGTDDPDTILKRPLGRILFKVLSMADAVVSISTEMSQSYLRTSLSPNKLRQIHNGVSPSQFMPGDECIRRKIRKSLKIPNSALLVIFAGLVSYLKGVDLLLRAWEKVTAEESLAWLILAGPLGDDPNYPGGKTALRAWIERTPRVCALGYQANISDLLGSGDLFILPSRLEGVSNALLEAMASGLACIASRIKANQEVIQDGENGLLFEPENVEHLRSLILQLLRNPEKRSSLGDGARAAALKNYSLEEAAAEYTQLYYDLLENHITNT